jgi:uncharacterized RDD family membrane protein YckC
MSDNSFSISTSQNVSISYQVAGVGERILAYLIDVLIKIGYIFFIVFAALVLSSLGSKTGVGIVVVLLYMPLLFYTLLFETFMQGQTPGKKSRKIKVVRIDGEQATFSSYLLRWLFILVDIYFFYAIVGILTIVLNKKGQRVGDIVAGTTVIRVGDTASLKDTIYEKLNQDHEASYPEVRKLTPEEVQLIKKVLNTQEYLENYDMVYTLTNKIQSKMNVARREASPEEFLRTVVKDYNSITDE